MTRPSLLVAAITLALMSSILLLTSPRSTQSGLRLTQYRPIEMVVSQSVSVGPGKQRICVILRSLIPDQIIQLDAQEAEQVHSDNLLGQSYEQSASGALISITTGVTLVILGVGTMDQCLLYTYPNRAITSPRISVSATTQAYKLIQTVDPAEPL